MQTDTQANPALLLPAPIRRHVIGALLASLPPPPMDSAETRADRDQAAIAALVALAPANAIEAELAATHIGACAHWNDCLRLARQPEITPDWATKCCAQASSMLRQAFAALRLLLRLQVERRGAEADAPKTLAGAPPAAAVIRHHHEPASPPEPPVPAAAQPEAAPPALNRQARRLLARLSRRQHDPARSLGSPAAAIPPPHLSEAQAA